MPWSTPTLATVRSMVRDSIRAYLPGADATVPNSVLRVMSDTMGALCHLTLQYVDWLSLQLMPDTAEREWLDREGNIWLVNADGSTGRKMATLASGTVNVTGIGGTILPAGTDMAAANIGGSGTTVTYETTAQIAVDANEPTPAPIRALDPGTVGNQLTGASLQIVNPPPGVDGTALVAEDITNGTDTETDDELRARVLRRIRQPPMGGCDYDYEAWALAVPGVTRAWCAGNEMGIGTVTVRFMMDDLRADNGGFPLQADIDAVSAYIETVRPVTVKQCYVLAPLRQPIDFAISKLNPNNQATQAAIVASIQQMLFQLAAPGQTIYAAWKYAAVMNAPGVISFDMTTQEDDVMPAPGYMAVLGDVYWSNAAPTVAQIESQHGRPPRQTNRK